MQETICYLGADANNMVKCELENFVKNSLNFRNLIGCQVLVPVQHGAVISTRRHTNNIITFGHFILICVLKMFEISVMYLEVQDLHFHLNMNFVALDFICLGYDKGTTFP